jgi:transposase
MFGPGPATKIFVAVEAVDMRKGFEGLFGLVRDHLLQDPLNGHLYLFANQRHTRLKALIWDGSGLWVCAKRLERGRFHWPKAAPEARSVSLRPEELSMLLNGLDLTAATPRRNWFRQAVGGA